MARCIAHLGLTQCRKIALYFGKWSGGGLCVEHAVEQATEFGVADFHLEFRDELATLTAKQPKE